MQEIGSALPVRAGGLYDFLFFTLAVSTRSICGDERPMSVRHPDLLYKYYY